MKDINPRTKCRGSYRVVPNVAGGGPEVNDARSFRTAAAERVHVGHHVMPQALLFLGRHLEVDVGQV